MKSCRILSAIAVLAVAAAGAQTLSSGTMAVRGEIVTSGPILGGLTVELMANGNGLTETAVVEADGSFEFRYATQGSHQLRVMDSRGQVIHEEYVMINTPQQALSIRLPQQQPSANRSGDSTISLQEMTHKVPASAQKAFRKGEQAASKGSFEQARGFFQEAVTLDPEFVGAYNELGATDVHLNELPEAAAQFQKVIEIVPEHPLALPNLSIVLAKMNRLKEAGEVARRALKVVPASGKIHYILAVSLLAEHGNIDEAILHFERAAPEVPTAHVVAADLLAQRGHPEQAIRHLEEYLLTASSTDSLRPKAEARLAELRQ